MTFLTPRPMQLSATLPRTKDQPHRKSSKETRSSNPPLINSNMVQEQKQPMLKPWCTYPRIMTLNALPSSHIGHCLHIRGYGSFFPRPSETIVFGRPNQQRFHSVSPSWHKLLCHNTALDSNHTYKFHVIDINVAYHALIGRTWINKYKLVVSTYH